MKKTRQLNEKSFAEITFGTEDPTISQSIRRAIKSGKLRKIAPKIYTSNFEDSPENIFFRHRYYILGKLFPGAVISHRSALEGGFSSDKTIVLTYKYTKNITLPGMIIRLIKGHSALPDDTPFAPIFLSSRARAFLENFQSSRERAGIPKNLSLVVLEERLTQMAHVYGDEELNHLREKARELAPILHMEAEFLKLDKIISALLGTHSSKLFLVLP